LHQFTAIWDTGATNSVITQAVIDACQLVPTGVARVNHAQGVSLSETYLVNMGLPQQVIFPGVRVTKGSFNGADLLIGMDIISRGDFAVTNFGGLTKFSFRLPSTAHIDFVAESGETRILQPAAPTNRTLRAERRRQKFGR